MTEAPSAKLSNRWLVLALLLAIHIFNFADRFLVTGLVGPLKAAFRVGDGFMGLLMGPAFVVLYVAMGVPTARLADRASRVRIIAAGALLWSIATAATALAAQPWQLALARVCVGVGEACFVAPAYSLLSDYFPPERRGLVFAILGLATYFGQIIGQAGGPAIEHAHGWRIAFLMLGLPGAGLAGLFLLLVRDPPRTALARRSAPVAFAALLSQLAASPGYLLLMAAFALGSLSGVAFGFWGPELFARSYGIAPVAAKTAFAVNFGGAGLVGMLAFGAISDRLARRSMEGPVRIASLALGAVTVLILIATWLPSFTAAKAIAIPCGLLGGGWSIGYLAALQDLLPQRVRAGATALFLAVTTLAGFLVGPWATGLISQALGDDAHSLRIGLSATIPLGLVAALLGWAAVRRIASDRAQLDQAFGLEGAPGIAM